jgi:hypothetical protein
MGPEGGSDALATPTDQHGVVNAISRHPIALNDIRRCCGGTRDSFMHRMRAAREAIIGRMGATVKRPAPRRPRQVCAKLSTAESNSALMKCNNLRGERGSC